MKFGVITVLVMILKHTKQKYLNCENTFKKSHELKKIFSNVILKSNVQKKYVKKSFNSKECSVHCTVLKALIKVV